MTFLNMSSRRLTCQMIEPVHPAELRFEAVYFFFRKWRVNFKAFSPSGKSAVITKAEEHTSVIKSWLFSLTLHCALHVVLSVMDNYCLGLEE